MPEKMTWTVTIQVAGGPTLADSQTLTVDAYDLVEMVIPDNAAGKAIQVQPGEASQVRLLLIKASAYGDKLTYSVGAAEADEAKRIPLDTLQLLLGKGSVGLYGKAPQTFFFYNTLGKDVTVTICAGRLATTV